VLHRLLFVALSITLVAVTSACEKKPAGTGAPAPEVLVMPVEKKNVDLDSVWIGTTVGYVNAEIRPKIQGYLLEQTYRDGSVVKMGDLLFKIDPRQFQAALDQAIGQLGRAQAALGKSEMDVTRYRPLAAEGAVSQEELDNAVQARYASAAQVASAQADVQQARLNLEWTSVRSPVTGIAAIATAQVGNLVSPTDLLTTVSQLDPMKVSFPISENEYLRFASGIRRSQQSGPSADAPPLELILSNGAVYAHPGKFFVTGLDVSATTGTIMVQGVFPNPDNYLRPGQFAKVRAATDRRPEALVIPQRAVSQLQGINQVAVVGADDKVVIKAVELGPRTRSGWIVDKGLEAGERVVVEGLQKIRNGVAVVPKPAPASDIDPGAAPTAGK
jgi:membrane fusion protein (multidrug efflux system)